MKETNLLKRLYFPFCIFISAFLLFVYSCNRSELIPVSEVNDFSVVVAKKWWASHFTKSAEYTSYNENSPLTPYKSNKRKFVSWSKAVYYRSGDFQFIEMPLQYDRKTVLMIGMQDIMGTPEASRIAKAALQKLLIIKAPDGSISVRIVTLVPSVEYARKHFYDLSGLSVNKLPSDFSGYKLVSKWDNSHVKTFRVVKGKLAKRINLKYLSLQEEAIAKQQNLARSADRGTTMSATTQICHYEWIPIMVTVCVIVTDDPGDTGVCEEYESGNGTWEEVCEEGPPDPSEPPPCEEWDYCCQYGIGCGTDDPDPNDPDPDADPDPCDILATNNNVASNLLNGKYLDHQEDDMFSVFINAFADGAELLNIERSVSIKLKTTLPDDGMASTPAIYELGTTDIHTGDANSVTTETQTSDPGWTIIAGIHSHQNGARTAPSIRDLYSFYSANQANPDYQYQFVFAYDGSRYVYTITDKQAFNAFMSSHPQSQYMDADNSWNNTTSLGREFNKTMDYLVNKQGMSRDSAYELALAYSLSQNNIGVTLSKRDANGNFKGIHVNKDATQDKKKYNKVTPTNDCNL